MGKGGEKKRDPGDGLERIIEMVRPEILEKLTGPNASSPEDVAEVLTLLLAYSLAIEQALSAAAGRFGTMPGHSISVRGYVAQALEGEGGDLSSRRLSQYFRDSIGFFMRMYSGVQEALDKFAEDLADALRPAHIESQVSPSAVLTMLGLHEGAYWRAYRERFRTLDAAALRELASSVRAAKIGDLS